MNGYYRSQAAFASTGFGVLADTDSKSLLDTCVRALTAWPESNCGIHHYLCIATPINLAARDSTRRPEGYCLTGYIICRLSTTAVARDVVLLLIVARPI